ncbi:MAG: hypothetical protein ABEK50_01615, partial [bacterium]
DVLLDQPVNRYLEEFRKFEPEESLDEIGEIFLVVAEWEQTPRIVEGILTSGIKQVEQRSIGELLDVLGVRDRVKDRVPSILDQHVQTFLSSKEFNDWSSDTSNSNKGV